MFFGLPAPPPPPCTHGSSEWFILDGLVNHSTYFREDILNLASVTVSYQGKNHGCSSPLALHFLKLQLLCLWQHFNGAAGRQVHNGPWCSPRQLDCGFLTRVSDPHTLFAAAAAADSCAPQKKIYIGEKKVLPFSPGPPVTLLVLSARLCLPTEQAWPEERRRLVPAGRVSGGRWMQYVQEAHSRDMTAHPRGCTCAGKKGRTGLAFSLPFSLGSTTPNTFSEATSVFFPNSLLNTL